MGEGGGETQRKIKRRWRKRVIMLLVFLLGGAIINVAVAWGCGWWSKPEDVHFSSPYPPYISCRIVAEPTPLRVMKEHERDMSDDPRLRKQYGARSFGWRSFTVRYTGYERGAIDFHARYRSRVMEAGWPWRSLTAREYDVRWLSSRNLAREGKEGLRLKDQWFPLRPIWPGFGINTVFYAVDLWLLIRGPFVLRRRIRLMRGRCPMCAYDLQGAHDNGCSECGWGRSEFNTEGNGERRGRLTSG